jgi:hypothetical protein
MERLHDGPGVPDQVPEHRPAQGNGASNQGVPMPDGETGNGLEKQKDSTLALLLLQMLQQRNNGTTQSGHVQQKPDLRALLEEERRKRMLQAQHNMYDSLQMANKHIEMRNIMQQYPSIDIGGARSAFTKPVSGRLATSHPIAQEHGRLSVPVYKQEAPRDSRGLDAMALISQALMKQQNEQAAGMYLPWEQHPSNSLLVRNHQFINSNPRSIVEQRLAQDLASGKYENSLQEYAGVNGASHPFDVIRDRLVEQYGAPKARIERKITNSSYLVRFNVTLKMATNLFPLAPDDIKPNKKSEEFQSLFKHSIMLIDVFGKHYPVRYEGILSSGQRHNRLTTGWCSAARSIGLDVGDVVVLERWTEDRTHIHVWVKKVNNVEEPIEPETKRQRKSH